MYGQHFQHSLEIGRVTLPILVVVSLTGTSMFPSVRVRG